MKRLINLTIIIFIILAIRPSAKAYDSYRHADSLALVNLYINGVGQNWINKGGWLTTYITSWYGITTQTINGHVRVTEIRLPNNNLQNILVLNANLDQLQVLDVHDNPFTSHDDYSIFGKLRHLDGHNTNMGMPSNIGAGNLSQLQVLNLQNNNITQLSTGNPLIPGPTSLPASMANLTNLTYLNLRDNQFTGNISWVSTLTKLTVLDLTTNKLSGTIPSSLWNITSLTYLSLFNNQFTGTLPATIGNLTNLTLFSLAVNQFSGSIPSQIGNLVNLKELWLNNNSLTGSLPSQMSSLTKLTHLYLNANQLTGSIPTFFRKHYFLASY
jgi:Leucine-rich repeat (LRR) protein